MPHAVLNASVPAVLTGTVAQSCLHTSRGWHPFHHAALTTAHCQGVRALSACQPLWRQAFPASGGGRSQSLPAQKRKNPLISQRAYFLAGGEGEIRTLGTLLTYTRFPIVLLRPARTPLRAQSQIYISSLCGEGKQKMHRNKIFFCVRRQDSPSRRAGQTSQDARDVCSPWA